MSSTHPPITSKHEPLIFFQKTIIVLAPMTVSTTTATAAILSSLSQALNSVPTNVTATLTVCTSSSKIKYKPVVLTNIMLT